MANIRVQIHIYIFFLLPYGEAPPAGWWLSQRVGRHYWSPLQRVPTTTTEKKEKERKSARERETTDSVLSPQS